MPLQLKSQWDTKDSEPCKHVNNQCKYQQDYNYI